MSHGKLHLRGLYQKVLSTSRSDFVLGNQVTLLHNGAAYFPAIETAFDRARHEIYLATYIYENDATGQRIADALIRAARRGVKVYVLIDGYGSKDLPRSMLDRLRMAGVKTLIFRPRISPWTFRRKRLRRMHRKIVVVDREIAFVGGINIIDDREATAGMASRYDYAVAVEGPLVDAIRLSAQRLWSMVAWSSFRKGMVRTGSLPRSTFTGGAMSAAFLLRDNFHHRRDIEAAYLRAIKQAESEIILANAYFLPGHDFRHALINAARRGVRVVLLLQGKVEYLLEHLASRALYGNLLDAGVEIYEYPKGFLHAKVAVIDGHWATVGSSNIDPFSLLLSREANVVVDDEAFGATLAQSLKKTVETDGQRILTDKWKQQPAGLRFISWLCYGLLRLMMGISGYARENDRARSEGTPTQEK
ncbi:MAG: cardiolipin synthase ClsB [Proteobacteria bacterium]|nr:cardiolipin synthase ClsB [Pseudomonadota bacterium]MBU4295588.1 cardiolipin synthase ClsB [Pseudomonadota bacterium]MCG2747377.1 cardiolipin synthase ClsB [Desulfobulbaceae bacterium]